MYDKKYYIILPQNSKYNKIGSSIFNIAISIFFNFTAHLQKDMSSFPVMSELV